MVHRLAAVSGTKFVLLPTTEIAVVPPIGVNVLVESVISEPPLKRVKSLRDFEPEQQIKAFANAGTFPSQLDAYENPELTDFVNPYFNSAPTGQISINRAEAVTVVPYKSANYFKYQDALQNAVTRVFDGSEDAKTSWKTWIAEAEAFS